ncbi:DUF1707 SHOCT-like domain-containing protein [Corynebacterium lactis]|uniref:Uncharacterized protein n=1 Tax=Corynebacterium lactis RW2-5 TaxID=1408189 RepID=A0A0K2H2G4_9CORY|nr:LiaF domain-containing protein [Corynebacterium lactis]ALA68138.1 hypothetical protein CLAC_11145 [Corynebacterium lactis RW2-5]
MSDNLPHGIQPGNSDKPRMRAGNQAREKTIAKLEWAFRDGQIDFAELQERTQAAHASTYVDQLPQLVNDLTLPNPRSGTVAPAPHNGEAVGRHRASASGMGQVERQSEFQRGPNESWVSLAAFSGNDKKGRWHCAPQHTVAAAFGGVELDLTQATLSEQDTFINVGCAFGGVDILIPDSYALNLQVLPVFGGATTTGEYLGSPTTQQSTDPSAQPRITVRGFVAFGGVEVKWVPSA